MTLDLHKLASSCPALSSQLYEFADLQNRKLWHQLTESLLAFLQNPEYSKLISYGELYEGFISKFEAKINQLKFARICASIAHVSETPERSSSFLTNVAAKRERLGPEAALYVDMEILLLRLSQGDTKDVEGDLKSAKVVLDGLAGAESAVCSHYYRAALEYHKIAGPPDGYYRNALMYLAYTPMESLPQQEKCNLAIDISLAALTGEGVYNFEEVLATPILSLLQQTDYAWLSKLLRIFERGDVDRFAVVVDQHREAYYSQPALANREEFIKEKVVLLSLMNLVFETPSHERTISFGLIADRGRLNIEQVYTAVKPLNPWD